MSNTAHLNKLEIELLARFQKAALGRRCSTKHFFSDDFTKGIGQVKWLEAMPIGDNGWVILHKQKGSAEDDNVEQFVHRNGLNFYDTMFELSAFEFNCLGAGMLEAIEGVDVLLPKPSVDFRDVALENGIVFNIDGQPHPTMNGQIIGNNSFPDDIFEKAITAGKELERDTLAARTQFISDKPLEDGIHLYDEIEAIEKAIKYLDMGIELGTYKITNPADDFRGIATDDWVTLVDRFKLQPVADELYKKYKQEFLGNFQVTTQKTQHYYSNIGYALTVCALEEVNKALEKSILRQDSETANLVTQALHLFHFHGLMRIASLKYSWMKKHKPCFGEEYETYKQFAADKYCQITGCDDKAAALKYVEAQCMNEFNDLADKTSVKKLEDVKKWLEMVVTELKQQQAGNRKKSELAKLPPLHTPLI